MVVEIGLWWRQYIYDVGVNAVYPFGSQMPTANAKTNFPNFNFQNRARKIRRENSEKFVSEILVVICD